jgi:DHA1 family bicyclomycin/chloramphenicol resistance-like MFS transporter
MMVVFSVIPIAAPLAGAQLLVWRGWPAVFWLAAAAALALFAAVAAGLRETAPAARRSIHPAHLARGFGAMLAERRFLVPFLVMVCAQFGIVCYVSNSSFTLVRGFGVSPREYSFLFALSASGQIAGAWLASRAVPRHGLARTLRFGTAVAFASGALGAALAWAGATHWSSVVLPFLAFLFATTFIIPNATAAALTPFPHSAGSASSLMGAIAFAVGAAASAALGALFDGTARPMASAVALAGAGAFFIERRFFRGAA